MPCAYCGAAHGYEIEHSVEKTRADGKRTLLFQTLKCGNCSNFTLMIRNAGGSGSLLDYRRIPYSNKVGKHPESWPDDVGRYWQQSRKAIQTESWDGAAMLIRSCLQLSLRHADAQGKTLRDEIEDLVKKGTLPPLMKEWSTEVRLLGNESTHPTPGAEETSSADVKTAMKFLEFLLRYLFSLPAEIDEFRTNKQKA
jgi:hypothetical protein|tara:strand:- start:18 stop:608 length:591 start_codon:yes stop_codon:yes gene_type:complete